MNTDDNLDPIAPVSERRVSFVASAHFVPLLRELRSSLIVSTYQAGKIAVIGTDARPVDPKQDQEQPDPFSAAGTGAKKPGCNIPQL